MNENQVKNVYGNHPLHGTAYWSERRQDRAASHMHPEHVGRDGFAGSVPDSNRIESVYIGYLVANVGYYLVP